MNIAVLTHYHCLINIVCIGKVKEPFYRDAINEYTKRLSKYTKVNITELDDYKSDNKDICLKKESELILKNINTKSYIITLEIEGKQLSSIELSNKINDILIVNPDITFIIGGSYGLHQTVKDLSDYKLSFSKMTFPHQLFRVILLEQIYRSFKILNNETYHK